MAMIYLRAFEELGQFLALAQLHVRLFPVRPLTGEAALALHLAVRDGSAHMLHFGPEQGLDGALDFGLVCAHRDMEHDGAAVLLAQNRRLLGNQRPADHIGQLHRAPSFSTAALVATTRDAFIMSRATTCALATNRTPG